MKKDVPKLYFAIEEAGKCSVTMNKYLQLHIAVAPFNSKIIEMYAVSKSVTHAKILIEF